MTRTILVALVVGTLAAPAAAGELIELRDGKLIEADRVDVTGDHIVLHVAADPGGVAKQIRVRLERVDPKSAARAWAATLGAADADDWLRLAGFARENALFDVAEHGYGRAAATSEKAAEILAAFRAARPREESRHHFETADRLLRAKQPEASALAARAAVRADSKGPYAGMARELLEILSAKPKVTQDDAATRKLKTALKRLEPRAARGEARLQAVSRVRESNRATVVGSAARMLGEVATRLRPLLSDGVDAPTQERASRLLDRVQRLRVEGLLLLADLRLQSGADRAAMAAVHEVLAIDPAEPLALGLRERLLDDAEWEKERERDLLYSGARRRYHAYPYPARDVYSGLGLRPTRDPVRGLGKLPYSRPYWDDAVGGGGIAVLRRRR
jgi:hypothetical protein